MPPDTSEAVVLALGSMGQFPPPKEEGWKLVHVLPGRYQRIEQAKEWLPDKAGKYVVAIGVGEDKMRWELVTRVEGQTFLPALKPFEPYHFAEYVLRYNRFSEAEIPIYSGLTGQAPLRVPDHIWQEVIAALDGEFVKQGDIYVFHAPEKERPPYMRAAPTWRDVASTEPIGEPVILPKRLPSDIEGFYDEKANVIYVSDRLTSARREEVVKHELEHARQFRRGITPTSKYVPPSKSIREFLEYLSDPLEVSARAQEKGEPISKVWDEVFRLRAQSMSGKLDEMIPLEVDRIVPSRSVKVVPDRDIPLGTGKLIEWHTNRLCGHLGPNDPKPIMVDEKAIRIYFKNQGNGIIAESILRDMGMDASSDAPFSVTVPLNEQNLKILRRGIPQMLLLPGENTPATTMDDRFTIDCSFCGFLQSERTLAEALAVARRLEGRHHHKDAKVTVFDLLAQKGACQAYDSAGHCLEQKPFHIESPNQVRKDLQASMREEAEAEHEYLKRGAMAVRSGDPKTSELYQHVAAEEGQHRKEFEQRLREIPYEELVPCSPEYLAYTIADIGYRELVDEAFQSAIARAKGE